VGAAFLRRNEKLDAVGEEKQADLIVVANGAECDQAGDFGGELGDAVRNGRRQEFARFEAFRDAGERESIPDPQAERTFDDSKLDWERLADPAHSATLRWYRDLLAVRREHIVPLLPALAHAGEFSIVDDGALIVRWRAESGAELTLMANLSARATPGFPAERGSLLWQEGHADAAGTFSAWSLRWTLRA